MGFLQGRPRAAIDNRQEYLNAILELWAHDWLYRLFERSMTAQWLEVEVKMIDEQL